MHIIHSADKTCTFVTIKQKSLTAIRIDNRRLSFLQKSKKASQCTCAVLVCVSMVARIADTAVRLLAGRNTLSMLTQLDQRRADILGRPHTVTITQTPERLGRLDRTQLTVAVLSPALAILLTTAALPRYAPSEWIRANAVLQLTEAAAQPLSCNTTHDVVQAGPSKRHIVLRVN